MRFIRVGDYVQYDEVCVVKAIKKCQPDGECIFGLDGVNLSMITDKIILTLENDEGIFDIPATLVDFD